MSEYSSNRSSDATIVIPVFVLLGGLVLMLGALLSNRPQAQIPPTEAPEVAVAAPTTEPAEPPTSTPEPPTEVAAVPAVHYDLQSVAAGQSLYQVNCAACHGPEGRGIPGVGKDLIVSEFMDSLTDEELLDFIIVGRPVWDPANTTGIAMPPRGINPSLPDADIEHIIAFLRTGAAEHAGAATGPVAQAPTPTVPPPTPAAAEDATPTEPFVLPIHRGGDAPTSTPRPEQVFDPQAAYFWSCSGCHGTRGEGLPGYVPSLAESEKLASDDAVALFEFIALGRPPADPAIEFPHPIRGEYPALTDEQIHELIEFVRTFAAGN